jgi:hypothetical protein
MAAKAMEAYDCEGFANLARTPHENAIGSQT